MRLPLGWSQGWNRYTATIIIGSLIFAIAGWGAIIWALFVRS